MKNALQELRASGRVVVVNIGNTTLQVAFAAPGKLWGVREYATSALLESGKGCQEIKSDFTQYMGIPWLVASVVPEVTAKLHEVFPTQTMYCVSPDFLFDWDFSRVNPETVGSDRLSNTAAAFAWGHCPCVILDCGTAITTEVVAAGGRLVGGAIFPGREVLRSSLAQNTAQLPEGKEGMASLPEAIGHNTAEAIDAGIELGSLGAIEYVLNRTKHEVKADMPVFAVGGDADFFAQNMNAVTRGPSLFTLRGIAAIATGTYPEIMDDVSS